MSTRYPLRVVVFVVLLGGASAAGQMALAAGRLRGPAARKATACALLTFVRQFRKIGSIYLNATVSERNKVVFGKRVESLRLLGRYRFWARRERYRIDWRIAKSNYSPLAHQIWTFNGRRYEGSTGVPNTLIAIYHHRPIGLFGPGQSNLLFAPILFLCNRHTPRQPGNWLDWWRVRHHPRSVAGLAKNRVIHWFEYTPKGAKFVFSIRNQFLRYPAPKAGRATARGAPPLRFVRFEMVLRKRGRVYLPVDQFPLPAVRGRGGIHNERRFIYRRFAATGGRVFLPVKEEDFIGGRWHISVLVRRLETGVRVNPARFSINPALAPGLYEGGRIIGFTHLPPAPARTQHLGKTR